jgi:hypothetical protein
MHAVEPSASLELKVFVPARDFALSVEFYREVGFVAEPLGDGLVCFRHGERCAFLLQDSYEQALAHNLMLHLWVGHARLQLARSGWGAVADRTRLAWVREGAGVRAAPVPPAPPSAGCPFAWPPAVGFVVVGGSSRPSPHRTLAECVRIAAALRRSPTM